MIGEPAVDTSALFTASTSTFAALPLFDASEGVEQEEEPEGQLVMDVPDANHLGTVSMSVADTNKLLRGGHKLCFSAIVSSSTTGSASATASASLSSAAVSTSADPSATPLSSLLSTHLLMSSHLLLSVCLSASTLHHACCYDEIKGTQDHSHAHSLILSQLLVLVAEQCVGAAEQEGLRDQCEQMSTVCAAGNLISPQEASIVCMAHHMQSVCFLYQQSVQHVQQLLWNQVHSALGKVIASSLFIDVTVYALYCRQLSCALV